MVQIIPRNPQGRERFMQQLEQAAGGVGKGFGDAFAGSQQQKYSQRLNQQKNQQFQDAVKMAFPDFQSTGNEDVDKAMIVEMLKGKQEEAKFGRDRMESGQKSMDDFNRAQELQYQKHQQDLELEGLKGGKAQDKAQQDLNDKVRPLKQGLDTIKEMRKLRKSENIGKVKGYTGIFSPATQQDRAKWITYGNSLIPLASSMPIRNQAEFEAMVGKLNDPDITLAAMDGVLDSMEHLLKTSIKGHAQGTAGDFPQETTSKERPPLTAFIR